MSQKLNIAIFIIITLSLAQAMESGESSINSHYSDAFEEEAKSEAFLSLTKDHLIDIISDDGIAASEDKIYEAVMGWYKANDGGAWSEFPNIYLPDVLKYVRFPLMQPIYLEQVSKDPLIKKCPDCLEYVKEAINHINSKRSTFPLLAQFQPRRINLFAVGGYIDGQYTSRVERYDPKSNKWTEVNSMKSPRYLLGVAALSNLLYAVGGWDGSTYFNSIECYDPRAEKWIDKVKPLEHGRATTNRVATLNGLLYVIGGIYLHSALQSVMKYDPSRDEWVGCKPLRQKKLGYAVGVLDSHIYVIGGFENGQALNTVECYDPTQNEWHDETPMITERYRLAAVAHGVYLYAVGGCGKDQTQIDSAERYDSRERKWEPILSMTERRSDHGIAVAYGVIYAIGGLDSNHDGLNSVEVYDPSTNT